MPIIRHIDQQPCEIHLRKLSAYFIFRKCRKQRVIEITAQNIGGSIRILINKGLGGLGRLGPQQIHDQHRRTRLHEQPQLVPEL